MKRQDWKDSCICGLHRGEKSCRKTIALRYLVLFILQKVGAYIMILFFLSESFKWKGAYTTEVVSFQWVMYSRFHELITYACIYKIVSMQRHLYLLDRSGLDTPKPCLYLICIPIQHLSFLFWPRCVFLSCDLAMCWIVSLSMDTTKICRLSKLRYSIYCDIKFLLMGVVGVIYLELDGYRVQAYEWSMRLV